MKRNWKKYYFWKWIIWLSFVHFWKNKNEKKTKQTEWIEISRALFLSLKSHYLKYRSKLFQLTAIHSQWFGAAFFHWHTRTMVTKQHLTHKDLWNGYCLQSHKHNKSKQINHHTNTKESFRLSSIKIVINNKKYWKKNILYPQTDSGRLRFSRLVSLMALLPLDIANNLFCCLSR